MLHQAGRITVGKHWVGRLRRLLPVLAFAMVFGGAAGISHANVWPTKSPSGSSSHMPQVA